MYSPEFDKDLTIGGNIHYPHHIAQELLKLNKENNHNFVQQMTHLMQSAQQRYADPETPEHVRHIYGTITVNAKIAINMFYDASSRSTQAEGYKP